MQDRGKLTASALAVLLFIGYAIFSGNDAILKREVRRALFGKYRADRMYSEEVHQKSIEAFRNNPNREQFLKNNPGFLEANPDLR